MAVKLLESMETLLESREVDQLNRSELLDYLYWTAKPSFLTSLQDLRTCNRWAETTFQLIRQTVYTLEDMWVKRVEEHGERTYFQEYIEGIPTNWSYHRIYERLKQYAAVFHGSSGTPQRVALLTSNSVSSACCDLACLTFDLFVSPLNVQFDKETLKWIIERVNITAVVTDSKEGLEKLAAVRKEQDIDLTIYTINGLQDSEHGSLPLELEASKISPGEINQRLKSRKRYDQDDIQTVMFTSGSTGKPKGVVFSPYNLISKRFARGAALPFVGKDEVFLCYLPLFHTFGRYLEMMGALYWSGTYIFAGNPSSETLFKLMRTDQPTTLISIPLRWKQLYEQCQSKLNEARSEEERDLVFRDVVGSRLKWGLSAAGYLEPEIFRFFQSNGVELLSGFGMTEATGGITMTPPGDYRIGSVGIPLPGVNIRFSKLGELQISGHYITSYLDPEPDAESDSDGAHWIHTGDLFKELEGGHLEIVDRIKDIYKNSRGQTVAPRSVEKKFKNVPGIKRTFLVGDGRAYNVLLIVPDLDDPAIQSYKSNDQLRDYYHQIVSAANKDLASYERVVNFAVLERDFELEKGELTPKGSFKRKVIEASFSKKINELYLKNYVKLHCNGIDVKIPRWFYRDLGILEDEIVVDGSGLLNRRTKQHLEIKQSHHEGRVQVGDFEYVTESTKINLGLFARQPLLWLGNQSLVVFSPVKEGLDQSLGKVARQVYLPDSRQTSDEISSTDLTNVVNSHRLNRLHRLSVKALFGDGEDALDAVHELGMLLAILEENVSVAIRRRLEALAWHPSEKVRSYAYRTLLLEEPTLDTSKHFPTFVQSGNTFLDNESIEIIAKAGLKRRKMQALRQRLYSYRISLDWPVDDSTRKQFNQILELLARFTFNNPGFYATIRAELVSWVLHDKDEKLAEFARELFEKLSTWYEKEQEKQSKPYSEKMWLERLVFGCEIPKKEVVRLKKALVGTTFLQQSIQLAYEATFDLEQIPIGGIWITLLDNLGPHDHFRLGMTTKGGRHYDLLIVLPEDMHDPTLMETNYWTMSITAYPFGQRVLPRYGCYRFELEALSLRFLKHLTAWQKIQDYATTEHLLTNPLQRDRLRKLFIRAMSTFVMAWNNSGKRIIPGQIIPTNVVIPEPDFRESAAVLSLAGLREYEGPLSLIRPLVRNFYQRTLAYYPRLEKKLNYWWLFDACFDALGRTEVVKFFEELLEEVDSRCDELFCHELKIELEDYLEHRESAYYVPLPAVNAIDRYHEWLYSNPGSREETQIQTVDELYNLYRLERFPELIRYHLYRYTYFADRGDAIQKAFDRLLQALFRFPNVYSTQRVELSELQNVLETGNDKLAFSKMVFPKAKSPKPISVLTVKEAIQPVVIVGSQISDIQGATYTIREPMEAAEIGKLYRLFFTVNYPKSISEMDRYYVVTDHRDRIIGGICYQWQGEQVVHLDGIVVETPLQSRGIGRAILEDFSTRLENQGVKVLKTHFFLRRFCSKLGFEVNERWGGLVRFLNPDKETPLDAYEEELELNRDSN